MANEHVFGINDYVGRSWSAQRIANRFPTWSRSREREDSVFQLLINPIGRIFDEIYSKLFQVRANCFIPTCDTNHIQHAYTLELPLDFEFDRITESPSGWIWQQPRIIGQANDGTIIEIKVLDNWIGTDKFFLPPTRLISQYIATGVDDIIIPTTSIWDLASVSIDNNQFSRLPGNVFVDIDSAIVFGGETSRGDIAVPKIILHGEPVERDHLETWSDHILFNSNTQQVSKNAWTFLSSLTVRNIWGDNATINVTRGFNKDAVIEPYKLLTQPFVETTLLYQFQNFSYGTGTYPLLQYVVPELSDVDLTSSGYNERELFYEKLLLDSSGQVIDPVVAIERMPFSPWLVVITATKLYIYPVSRSHCLNRQQEEPALFGTVRSSKLANILLTNRSHQIELKLNADRTWLHLSEDLETGVELFTRHISRQKPIQKVRFSSYYFELTSNWDDEPTRTYIDNTGTAIDISTDPNNGWIITPTYAGNTINWQDLRFSVNPLVDGITNIVYVMEVDVGDGNIQRDSILIHADDVRPMATFDLPIHISGNVSGMTYDYLDRLLVRITNRQVHELNLFWDYATVDFQDNIVYLREEYASISIESSEPWASGDSISHGSSSASALISPPTTSPTVGISVWESLAPLIP